MTGQQFLNLMIDIRFAQDMVAKLVGRPKSARKPWRKELTRLVVLLRSGQPDPKRFV